jgi:hypothetical protein
MSDNEFKPTEQEIEFLTAKRTADETSKVDINSIRPGMTLAEKKRVADKILEVWKK